MKKIISQLIFGFLFFVVACSGPDQPTLPPTPPASETAVPPAATPLPPTSTPSPAPTDTSSPTPTNTQTPTQTPTTPPYQVVSDLFYGNEDEAQRSLTIYIPTEAHQDVTLLVAGGEYYPSMLNYFADLGYTVVAFNTMGETYLEEIQDGFCAMAWAYANAEKYGINLTGLIPLGGSMWGGTAAILGLADDPTPFLEGCPYDLPETFRVRAVITQAGVFDYAQEADFFEGFIESITDYMEGTPDQAPEKWAAASAITWVKGDEPPFLLVHGTADTNVAPHQSEKFSATLKEAGTDVELVLLPDVDHYTSVHHPDVLKAIESYLNRLALADKFNNIGVGTIAYVSNRDGDYEIYLKMIPRIDDGPVRDVQLTDNEAQDSVPDWSPDGKKIAFASTRDGNWEIYVLDVEAVVQNPENAQIRRLTDSDGDDLSPAWSLDGTQIAFASDRDGDFDIYVMRADGTNLRQLTDNTSIETKPSWSPDGTKIAFDSGQGYERDIYMMDADGTNQERVIQAEGGWPAWSPDGSQIAYFDRRDGNPEIYVVDTDGSNRTRLTHNSTDDWEPSWSPDSEWLLYVSGFVPDIYMMRVDGSETYRLALDNSEDWSPVWRPGTPP